MNKKIAFIFPGQGAQYPGMGRDFFEKFEEAKAVFQKADEVLGENFSDLIFNGSKEEITLTKNSQLAIFITSCAILKTFETHFPDIQPTFCAGLSLGEYTALVAAKKITFEEALPLVKARGAYMQKACETNPGTMQVVLGMELAIVQETLDPIEGVWIANLNCPGQIVISGTKEGMEKAALLLKEKGARKVIPLDVSGAFHSGLMMDAQNALGPMIDKTNFHSSEISIPMNVTGDFVKEESQMRDAMTKQVTQSVLWQSDIEAMVAHDAEQFIEMGPGKTLSGMNKRIGVKVPTLSIEKVEDLERITQDAL